MKATYGVSGMMEWVALIPAGHNIVRVRFSGGSLSGYGMTPATFTTINPVVMRMIEESSYFRSGKIRLIMKEEDSGEEEGELSRILREIREREAASGKPSEGNNSCNGGRRGATFKKERK